MLQQSIRSFNRFVKVMVFLKLSVPRFTVELNLKVL